MPLTEKGNEIMGSMQKEYGAKNGEEVFYASKNAGKISGVDRRVLSGMDQISGSTVIPSADSAGVE